MEPIIQNLQLLEQESQILCNSISRHLYYHTSFGIHLLKKLFHQIYKKKSKIKNETVEMDI